MGPLDATENPLMSANAILLLARILLAFMFILAGFGKIADIGGTAGYIASFGLPAPTLLAVLVGLVELVGGLAVLVGYRTRIAAYALAAFCAATALVAHTDFSDMMQIINFQKNLAMAGGFLALAVAGAGTLSLDGRKAA